MYIPEHFKQDQWASAAQLITEYSFAQIITVKNDRSLSMSHVPVLYDEHSHELLFHLAVPNAHNEDVTAHESTVVFSGPHGYISPNWAEQLLVPTWNYADVQISGEVVEIEGAQDKYEFMDFMSNFYEKVLSPTWSVAQLNEKQRKGMLQAIRCYRMKINNWQAKLKLSQNRSVQAVEQVAQSLKDSHYPYQDNQALAQLMLKQVR